VKNIRLIVSTAAMVVVLVSIGSSRLRAMTDPGNGFCHYWFDEGASLHIFGLPGACVVGWHTIPIAGLCNVHADWVGC
jgi:hypothetical protein